MKAIVLTCDKYVNLVDHMIHTYQKIWPSNHFKFRIPYQNYPHFLHNKYGDKIELIRTKTEIKPTMQLLLDDIHDDEWVYWCIDDKYLIKIEEDKANKVYHWVKNISDPNVCGITFSRCRDLLKDKNLKIKDGTFINNYGQIFFERRNFLQIWIHQFVRAKVLKTLFDSFPDKEFVPKEMDYFIQGKQVPPTQKMYVSEKNMVVFGESTTRGKLTQNCLQSLRKYELEVPINFEQCEQKIIMGKLPRKLFGIEI